MNKILQTMSEALFDSDLVATRLALALGEMCWGIMLFWPGDTFARPTYSLMASLAPEIVWAVVFVVTSALQFSIVVKQAYYRQWARIFAAWNAILWLFCIGSMLASVYPPPAAVGGEIALAVSALWVWVRPYIIAEGQRRVCRR